MSLEIEIKKLHDAIVLLTERLGPDVINQAIEETQTTPAKTTPVKTTEAKPEQVTVTAKAITTAARKAVEKDVNNRAKAKDIISSYGATKASDIKESDLANVLKEIEAL